jgi:hypothetical protein
MNDTAKLSRLGLVVVRLNVGGSPYLLFRKDIRWGDITFLGGHESNHDNGNLRRAAYRELLEELPTARQYREWIDLTPLESRFHGPVFSSSANQLVKYEIEYFFVKFLADPTNIFNSMGNRTPNILLPEKEILHSSRYTVSELVKILQRSFCGDFEKIGYSWDPPLLLNASFLHRSRETQLFLHLKN